MKLKRPHPPAKLLDPENWTVHFMPAPEVLEWIGETFLNEDSRLYNEEHKHLKQAQLGVLWTVVPYTRQMHRVAGTAEMPAFRCSAWQKARQEQQLTEWFDQVPDFLITLDASYASQASDAQFCALVEHELYHCGQSHDAYGQPRFSKESGLPVFAMRGHDVEEFVGIVRRYGVGAAAGQTAVLVEASKKAPEVARIDILRACGTCHLKAA